jgi:two-component system, OmpR family, sensor histidine kinase CpxA
MNIRFPLYARILFWFFLNLLLLAAVFLVLILGQFHTGIDWMLAAADPRIQAVADVIVADLNDRPTHQLERRPQTL